jgi:hypothetical protein
MMNSLAGDGVALPGTVFFRLPDRLLHECGLFRQRAFPPGDQPGERAGHERGAGEPAGNQRHAGEVRHVQLARPGRLEPAAHQVRSPARGRVGDGGADPTPPG